MTSDPRQRFLPLLFPAPAARRPAPAAYDFDSEVRGLISGALRRCAKDRNTIALEMTIIVHGKGADEITKVMLDRWCAHDGPRFPLSFLPALIQVTGDEALLDSFAKLMGYRALDREQARLAEFGALELQRRDVAHRLKRVGGQLSADLLDRQRS